MHAKDLLGIIAMIATLGQVLIGMTTQVRKLHIERTTKGLSRTAVLTAGLGFTAWTAYSLWRPVNAYVLVPNALGAICSVIILIQIFAIDRGPRR
jgi:uncharacterized protein with PQ loop repeat